MTNPTPGTIHRLAPRGLTDEQATRLSVLTDILRWQRDGEQAMELAEWVLLGPEEDS